MKTYQLLAIAGLVLTANLGFTESVVSKPISSKTIISSQSSETFVYMLNGRIMIVQDGKTSRLRRDLRLRNGNVVMITGVIRRKDGIAKEIHNGQVIDLYGNISWKDTSELFSERSID